MNNNIFVEISTSRRKTLTSVKAKNSFKTVRGLKSKHPKNIVNMPKNVSLGNLNIISLQNKFESINVLIKDPFDIVFS